MIYYSSTYPSIWPSLYTLIVYVIMSPASILTGFFIWVYSAVVFPFNNGETFTIGVLSYTPFVFSSVSFTAVMNFLNAKSKYFPGNTKSS